MVFDINGELDYIIFPEGRILPNGGSFTYEYHLKDHLGSVRLAFRTTGSGKSVVQMNSYYPSGAPIADFGYSASDNRYKHTGMETIEDFSLNYLDNSARWRLNVSAPMWLGIDPSAEKYYHISPYAYCANNPIKNIDPDGKDYYSVNPQGYVFFVQPTYDSFDRLFVGTSRGEIYSGILYVDIYDKMILPQLSAGLADHNGRFDYVTNDANLIINKSSPGYDGHYAVSRSKTDMFNLFHFVARYTEVEWGLDGYKDAGGTEYVIRTSHDRDRVAQSSTIPKFADRQSDLTFRMHSHPGIGVTKEQEEDSMGYRRIGTSSAGVLSDSDWFKIRNEVDNNGKQYSPYYIHFPNTNHLYNMTYNGPVQLGK